MERRIFSQFEELKNLLTNAQVLKIEDIDKEFVVCTYALKRILGGGIIAGIVRA